MNRKFIAFLVTGLAMLWMGGVANAGEVLVLNKGFETGDFTAWSTSGPGSASVVHTDEGFGPTEGAWFADLSAIQKLSQNVSWNAGDTYNFTWNFIGKDQVVGNDQSFFEVKDFLGNVISSNVLANDALFAGTNGVGATGWQSGSYTFTSAGAGTINFVVTHTGANPASKLFVDTRPVPEPASMILLGTGIASMIGTRLRKKRASNDSSALV
jgi:hypothetical protein